jgi:hypothetical protein
MRLNTTEKISFISYWLVVIARSEIVTNVKENGLIVSKDMHMFKTKTCLCSLAVKHLTALTKKWLWIVYQF